MPHTFYEKDGVLVTDTAFINKNGNQDPIRNITSIEIYENWNFLVFWVMVILALFCLLVGVLIIVIAGIGWVSGIFSCIGVILLLTAKSFAAENSTLELLIGGGGIPQTGMSLPYKDPESRAILSEISKAIGESIANLQKT